MIVVDASVWVSYLLANDINHSATLAWLHRYNTTQQPIIGPILVLAEVGGAIARRSNQVIGQHAIDEIIALPNVRLVDMNYQFGLTAARLAADTQIKGSDAIYVEVARQLGIPLVTWDQEQLNRAGSVIQAFTPVTAP